MNTLPEAPKPPCTVYQTALPELRAGTLSHRQKQALSEHLKVCVVCHEQAENAATQVIEDAVLRHYDVPATAAHFLTLDAIRRQVALSEADDLHEINVNITPIHLYHKGTVMQTKENRHSGDEPTAVPSCVTALPRKRSTGRWRSGLAVASVIGLIAVFALVVHSFLGTPHIAGRTATKNQPSTWQQIAQFSAQHTNFFPNSSIILGVNDPHVIYKLSVPHGLAFWRSDDSGQTWHTLSFPSNLVGNDTLVMARLHINPLDAQMVWAEVIVGPEDTNCQPVTGATGCTFAYFSATGGATWTPEVMPDGLYIGGTISAQGQRLYTILQSTVPDPAQMHLVTSADGIHWSIIDSQLTAQNHAVEEYAATGTGSTVFATTAVINASFWQQTNREFWRSDDAGTHWTDLGAFPQGYTHLLGAATITGTTLVYYSNQDKDDYNYGAIKPQNVFASTNNGKTWEEAPTRNAPGGLQVGNEGYFGMLTDGAFYILFDKSVSATPNEKVTVEAAALYSWQPGQQSWTLLSQDLKLSSDGTFDGPWYTPNHRSVPAAFWEVTLSADMSNYVLWSCPLR